jgi:GTP-binding protein
LPPRRFGGQQNVILTPPHRLSLEDCIAFINDDELVEVTPAAIRMRERN